MALCPKESSQARPSPAPTTAFTLVAPVKEESEVLPLPVLPQVALPNATHLSRTSRSSRSNSARHERVGTSHPPQAALPSASPDRSSAPSRQQTSRTEPSSTVSPPAALAVRSLPVKAPAIASERRVRVLLYWGQGPVKISATGGGVLVDGRLQKTDQITLTNDKVKREQELKPQQGLITYQNTSYRGTLKVYPGKDRFQVINELSLEDYLRGVVPKELLDTSLEAVKAQAILARTYAVATAARSDKSSHWDLRDNTGHQVYGGANAEHHISDDAVRQTEGQVLAYQGQLCSAILYHSTCGGYTESNANAYGTVPVPYLRAVSCGAEAISGNALSGGSSERNEILPASISLNSLAERKARRENVWNASERGRGRAESAKMQTPSERPSMLGLHNSLGTSLEPMEKRFKYTSGGTSAWCSKSSFARWEACWTPTELGQEVGQKLGKSAFPIIAIDVEERTPSGRVKLLKVTFSNGKTALLGGDTLRNTMCYRNAAGAWCALPSTRFDIVEVSKKVIRVRGTGWGHGVGMCQWGAKELARRGYSAAKILNHYYAGTEVVPLNVLGVGVSSH